MVGGLQEHVISLQNLIITLQGELRYSQSIPGQWKAIVISFAVGCMTGVIGNYIFKWLNG